MMLANYQARDFSYGKSDFIYRDFYIDRKRSKIAW